MTGDTHAAVGAAIGVSVAGFASSDICSVTTTAGVIIAGCVGGLLPDSDLPGTKGRKYLAGGVFALALLLGTMKNSRLSTSVSSFLMHSFPVLVWVIIYLAIVLRSHSHRGFTHSLTSLAITAICLGLLPAGSNVFVIAFLLGMLSHIVIDLFNTKGEQLFWPLKPRFCFNLCTSSGYVNAVIRTVACVILILECTVFGGSEVLKIVRSVFNL